MSRLIDADKLIKDIANLLQPARPDETEMYKSDDIFWSLEKLIKAQPTAFDVDKVIEQLDELVKINMEVLGVRADYVNLAHVIKIVKAGGVDD
jgi:hypothetical protein